MALAENFISSNSYRPSDILKSAKVAFIISLWNLKGLTVEIGNTDAEGRLALADAMTWV